MPLRSRRLFWRFGAILVLAAVAGVLFATSGPSVTSGADHSDPGPKSTWATSSEPPVSSLAPVPGRWQYAPTRGKVLGTAGPLRTFRVAVEDAVPVTVLEFTRVVDETLGDPRSWAGAGTVRLQHVAGRAAANFTIYLATAQTAYDLCLTGDVDITIDGMPYTSCRVGSKVVINADRYTQGVPDYGAPLAEYRQYVINHEVGHWLGHDHVDCPGPGRPAPVMQQQTLDLQGCLANSWPSVDDAL